MNYRTMSTIDTAIGVMWTLAGFLTWSNRQEALTAILIGVLHIILGEIRMQRRH